MKGKNSRSHNRVTDLDFCFPAAPIQVTGRRTEKSPSFSAKEWV